MDENATPEEKSNVVQLEPAQEPEQASQPQEDPQEPEESPEEDYPLLVAVDTVIEDIEAQQKRLKSRNSGDLKSELRNNVYPMIDGLSRTLHDFIVEVLEMMSEENEEINEEEMERFRLEAIRRGRITIEVCKKIVSLHEVIDDPMILEDGMAQIKIPKMDWEETVKPGLKGILAWARDTIDQSVVEAEKVDNEPEEKEDADDRND